MRKTALGWISLASMQTGKLPGCSNQGISNMSLLLALMNEQQGLRFNWSKMLKTGFLVKRFILHV